MRPARSDLLRDPAAPRRLFWALAAIGVLWPLLRLAEFRPAVLFTRENLSVSMNFLATFLPPRVSADFLELVARGTLETLAMATAGIALAIALAAPLGLMMSHSLSVSRIGPGPGHRRAEGVRAAIRALPVGLRGIPELVWALVLVRVFGLGPASAVQQGAAQDARVTSLPDALVQSRGAPRLCAKCWLVLAAAVGLVWASFSYLSIDLSLLLSPASIHQMTDYVLRFVPPDSSPAFLRKTVVATGETLAISAIGTLLAVVLGLLLALPAAGRYGTVPRAAARLALNFLRSVPELVWAAFMVLFAGLGPFAGTLALGLHTTGVLGRLFGEALENTPPEPALSLVASGARPGIAFLYGTLPSAVPQLIAYSLYRWEMNVRMAAVLGFVGAGGLGQLLYYEFALLHERQACTVILAMLAVVVLIDGFSARLRRRLVAAGA